MRRSFSLGCLFLAVTAFAADTSDPTAAPQPAATEPACIAGLAGEVPALAPVADNILGYVAYQSLRYPLFTLTAAQLDALVAHVGAKYEVRMAFVKEANAWPEIVAMNLPSDYTVQSWIDSARLFDRAEEEFAEAREPLKAFEADPSHHTAALEAFEKARTSDVRDLANQLRMEGPKAYSSRSFWDRVETTKLGLVALRVAAFRTRSSLARAASERLEVEWKAFDLLSAYVKALIDVRSSSTYKSVGASLTRELATSPIALNYVAYLLMTVATPQEHAEIVFQTLTSNATYSNGAWRFSDEACRAVAARLGPSFFNTGLPPVFHPTPSLLDRLAMFGGATVNLTLIDGQKFTGRLESVSDWSVDTEGTVAGMAFINAEGQQATVGLDVVATLEIPGKFSYDAKKDGKMPLRHFGLTPTEREWLEMLTTKHWSFVDDALVKSDEVLVVARKLVSDRPIPARAQQVVADFLAVADVTREHPQRLDIVRDALANRVIAAYALELASRDVGPQNRGTLNIVAVSMYLDAGHKGWGADIRSLIRSDAGAGPMVAAMKAAANEDYAELTLLRHHDIAVQLATVEKFEREGGRRFAKDYARFVRAVDVRWKPLIDRVLVGATIPSIHFLPADQVALANQTQFFLGSLLRPDSAPMGLDKDTARLRFFNDEIPSVLGPIGRRDKVALLAALDRIAKAPTRTTARALVFETRIREAAATLHAALSAAEVLPWEAMDIDSSRTDR